MQEIQVIFFFYQNKLDLWNFFYMKNYEETKISLESDWYFLFVKRFISDKEFKPFIVEFGKDKIYVIFF